MKHELLGRATVLSFIVAAMASGARAAVLTGPIANPANGHEYFLLSQNDWTASEAEARSLGGHLVTINNADEDAWVVTAFANYGNTPRALWLGLNDVAVEGAFVWASGEQVTYTNWGDGEPNDHQGKEDWAHILPSTDWRFPHWNDTYDSSTTFGSAMHGVVEVVPEPASPALIVLIGTALAARRIRR